MLRPAMTNLTETKEKPFKVYIKRINLQLLKEKISRPHLSLSAQLKKSYA